MYDCIKLPLKQKEFGNFLSCSCLRISLHCLQIFIKLFQKMFYTAPFKEILYQQV